MRRIGINTRAERELQGGQGGMERGESKPVYIEGKEYLLTRTLDGQWAVWRDNHAEPYRCVISSSGLRSCDCPDFVVRRHKRGAARDLTRGWGGDLRKRL